MRLLSFLSPNIPVGGRYVGVGVPSKEETAAAAASQAAMAEAEAAAAGAADAGAGAAGAVAAAGAAAAVAAVAAAGLGGDAADRFGAAAGEKTLRTSDCDPVRAWAFLLGALPKVCYLLCVF